MGSGSWFDRLNRLGLRGQCDLDGQCSVRSFEDDPHKANIRIEARPEPKGQIFMPLGASRAPEHRHVMAAAVVLSPDMERFPLAPSVLAVTATTPMTRRDASPGERCTNRCRLGA